MEVIQCRFAKSASSLREWGLRVLCADFRVTRNNQIILATYTVLPSWLYRIVTKCTVFRFAQYISTNFSSYLTPIFIRRTVKLKTRRRAFILCKVFSWLNKWLCGTGRSQWPRGLRRGSVAVRLLGLRVLIPPGHGCLSLVSVVCCQVEVSATGWSLVQRSPTECGV
jgi:hypothetical protein